ncbi:hypothetical protein E6C67_08290 [Azospirillum sp. TSA2s]|uniref:hypothetical protein n=1 Tax=Azospirillum sp. TSA2s TaxID=709810 RepID=UPI0010A9B09A|nr:hypothetical protein [Azospirillum sp. TSA2s]QCG93938.1 hypothetical protein E6C67_08290 [Azospirillum sp. TSA2s]
MTDARSALERLTRWLKAAATAGLWIVGVFIAACAVMAFFRMPGELQISASVLAAGGMVSAALCFRRDTTINVYGNDWRVTDRTEGQSHG